MDVDPSFDYTNRYTLNGTTIKLHQNREPRFYASIGYDRGNYAVNSTNIMLLMRSGETHGWSPHRATSARADTSSRKACTPLRSSPHPHRHP
ncbi:hypothetical protein ACQ86N_24870 [Puia sp. P3]|uniref:hypothetical protein n=1 Tax=Puia sp. P3 TaxID=3423952 RepID=UPI003D67A6CC